MITTALCQSAKLEFLRGVHKPEHVYKLALYTGRAVLGPQSVSYTPSNEVEDTGYPVGGLVLTGFKSDVDEEGRAWMSFDNIEFEAERVTARGALVYNASVRGNPSLCALDFGGPIAAVNAPFRVTFPEKLVTIQ